MAMLEGAGHAPSTAIAPWSTMPPAKIVSNEGRSPSVIRSSHEPILVKLRVSVLPVWVMSLFISLAILFHRSEDIRGSRILQE